MIRPHENSAQNSVQGSALLQVDEDLLESLSETQQEQLASILETYLSDLESGVSVDKDMLLEANPELSSVLGKYLESIESLHLAGKAAESEATEPAGLEPGNLEFDRRLPKSSQLGDYIIQHEIGRGGMGVVYQTCFRSPSRQTPTAFEPSTVRWRQHRRGRR